MDAIAPIPFGRIAGRPFEGLLCEVDGGKSMHFLSSVADDGSVYVTEW